MPVKPNITKRTKPIDNPSSPSVIFTALEKPSAVRAVAAANGQNRISIIIPCHRVIGSDGSLTGYAGGLHRKKWLLEFESSVKQGKLF